VCAFCNKATDSDAPDEVLELHGYVADLSRVLGLGAHLACLKAAVHPRVADSMSMREDTNDPSDP
jgi:hypothetical protein